MLTMEIPRDNWNVFFNNFSQKHQGRAVKVELFNQDFGAQVEVQNLPLEGISAELKPNGKDEIAIIMGDDPTHHITHSILSPTHVRVEETDQLGNEIVQIEAADGVTTLLQFSSASVL